MGELASSPTIQIDVPELLGDGRERRGLGTNTLL